MTKGNSIFSTKGWQWKEMIGLGIDDLHGMMTDKETIVGSSINLMDGWWQKVVVRAGVDRLDIKMAIAGNDWSKAQGLC